MKKNGERCIFSKFPWKMHVNRQFFDRESPVKGCVCFITFPADSGAEGEGKQQG